MTNEETKSNQLLDALDCEFENIPGIESLLVIFGLNFPDSATPYQKAVLTLAHLMIALRDAVLKGRCVNARLITVLSLLADIIKDGKDNQR